MTTDSEFKRIVRARMEVTGENFTPAKLAVLEAARAAIPAGVDPDAAAALEAWRSRPGDGPDTTEDDQ